MRIDTDLVVVGAGFAGLGAAHTAREAGLRAVVLEASSRVGGRAWTTYPAALGGDWFDMGAFWFHDAANNPVADRVRAAGLALLRSDQLRQERTYVGDRAASSAETRAYDAAWPRYEAEADRLIGAFGDVPLAAVTASLADDLWAPTVEAWEGPVICAAPAEAFSARDWRRNALGGYNLVPEGGIGACAARVFAGGLDIRLRHAARGVDWGGGIVSVTTDQGAINARAVIVTVSTGVLNAGVIRFVPALPARTLAAIAALPMGLAIKVALRAAGDDRLGLPAHCSVDHQVARGSGADFMPIQFWPFGRGYAQGWIGGARAWELARDGEAAIIDHMLGRIAALFGARARGAFDMKSSLITTWDSDPWVRGAYCYALPGHALARDALAEPVGEGRLIFAGEACNTPYAGTVGGAWISGRDAARAVAERLAGR
jgi:monoamine oxidase